ncbi:TonB-dependent receptor [Novosphingobium sp. 9U]|uniref:TonB-dependent receptor n=1 Tax=Novosphingobium sp. 9U TaxID=2653158 RepID=UPI0012F2B1C1|nr:TonB-dependent receptor [Novosphingobium sp. 9U]VWX50128.1 Outer membrane receptor protein [Novosphingobium sp. 9U]
MGYQKILLSIGAGAAALAVGTLAQAQDAGTPQAADGVSAPGEIVVTAQRRAEALEKVPVAVTAVTAQIVTDLNLKSVDEIAALTPSVVFDTGLGFSQSYIRGIGASYPQAGLESPVAVYVDGSYLQRTQGVIFDLLDPGTIQVLKGPQGTLYGRNATGGVILLSSADPTFETEGHVTAEYGNYEQAMGEAVANFPLSDTLAVRFAGRYRRGDGWVHNLATGDDAKGNRTYALRGKLLWKPTSEVTAKLTVDHNRQKLQNPFAVRGRLTAPGCLACALGGSSTSDPYSVYNDVDVDLINKGTSVNLSIEGKFDGLNVSSVTAYRKLKVTNSILDADGTDIPLFAFANDVGGTTWTQDFTVSTETHGWYDVLFGASFLDDLGYARSNPNGLAFAPIEAAVGEQPFSSQDVRTRSAAAFAELTLRPTERLSLTGGARYSYDHRDIDVDANLAAVIGFGGGVTPPSFKQSVSFRSVTPRFVIAYDLDTVNLYASFNKGFRAGGYNTPTFAPQIAVAPEKIKNYEIGAKYRSPDGSLRLSLAAFYYKYTDVQVSVANIDAGGTVVQNAASADGRGVELEGSYSLNKNLRFFGGGSYLKAKYKSFEDASVVDFDPGVGLFQSFEDLSGSPLPRSPKWTGFIGLDASMPIGDTYAIGLNGLVRYTDGYDFFPGAGGPLRLDRQPAVTMINASIDFGPADETWQLSVFGNNLADERYYEDRSTLAPFNANESVAQPRTYGVRASYKW